MKFLNDKLQGNYFARLHKVTIHNFKRFGFESAETHSELKLVSLILKNF